MTQPDVSENKKTLRSLLKTLSPKMKLLGLQKKSGIPLTTPQETALFRYLRVVRLVRATRVLQS